MAEANGALEQLLAEHSGQAVSPPSLRNHHAVYVQEPAWLASKPEKMTTVVVVSVFKCEQQRGSRRDEQRKTGRSDQLIEAL